MKSNMSPIDYLLIKLQNSLKGSALLVKEANSMMYTPEEKLAEFEAIEQLTLYIRNYHENMQKLQEYDKVIKEQQERFTDDGR